jgi:sensor histidine kinase regulating citrate/malate metabolism
VSDKTAERLDSVEQIAEQLTSAEQIAEFRSGSHDFENRMHRFNMTFLRALAKPYCLQVTGQRTAIQDTMKRLQSILLSMTDQIRPPQENYWWC